MKSYTKYFVCVASLLIAAVLPASAGSITYSETETISGKGITNTNVTATFTVTKSGSLDTISKGSLTFSGVFGNFTVNFTGTCSPTSPCTLAFSKGGNSGTYTLNLSQLAAGGTIWNDKLGSKSENGTYSYSLSMPEGGSKFSYLAPAGLVIFGAIFLVGLWRSRASRQGSVWVNQRFSSV